MAANESIANHWESEILDQLDNYAREYNFPILNNVSFHNADVRLKVFRSSSEWLIIFEEIALFQEYTFIDSVSAYGNKIEKPGLQIGIDDFILEAPGHLIWDNAGKFLLDKWSFEILINGQHRRFEPSSEDYANAKIDVKSKTPEPAKILRLLTFLMPNNLFMTDNRILDICGRTNCKLERFLLLDDWYHPNIADDELPSQSICLQNLAIAISRNDPNLYSCPPEMLNTHWSNWEWE